MPVNFAEPNSPPDATPGWPCAPRLKSRVSATATIIIEPAPFWIRSTTSKIGGLSAAGEAQARNVPTGSDTSPLLAEWHQQLHTLQGALGGFAPRPGADLERAEALADVEGFMQQAIMRLSSRRDPRPELLRHADELERRRFGYAMDAAGEAQMLKTMAREYGRLL